MNMSNLMTFEHQEIVCCIAVDDASSDVVSICFGTFYGKFYRLLHGLLFIVRLKNKMQEQWCRGTRLWTQNLPFHVVIILAIT